MHILRNDYNKDYRSINTNSPVWVYTNYNKCRKWWDLTKYKCKTSSTEALLANKIWEVSVNDRSYHLIQFTVTYHAIKLSHEGINVIQFQFMKLYFRENCNSPKNQMSLKLLSLSAKRKNSKEVYGSPNHICRCTEYMLHDKTGWVQEW